MECKEPKCECHNCKFMNDNYCKCLKTDNPCYKCDWKGAVRLCSCKNENGGAIQ